MNAIETYGTAIQEMEKFALQLDPSVRAEAFRFLLNRQFGGETEASRQAQVEPSRSETLSRELSPQELLRKAGVQTMNETAAVLGYWIEMHQGATSFSSGQLKEAFDRAREAPPANPSDVVAKLEGAGKLMRAERVGTTQHYRLTRTAIEEIEQKIGSPMRPVESSPASKIAFAPVALTSGGTEERVSSPASTWMRQHQITREQLEHVFSIETDRVDLIVPGLPAESKRQQTLQAYLMSGLSSFIHTGDKAFADSAARALCEHLGCFDQGNHSTYTKSFGNMIAGSKESGWKLTGPGLMEAANVIKQLLPK